MALKTPESKTPSTLAELIAAKGDFERQAMTYCRIVRSIEYRQGYSATAMEQAIRAERAMVAMHEKIEKLEGQQ